MKPQYAVRALRILRQSKCRLTTVSGRVDSVRNHTTSSRDHPVDEVVETQLDKGLDAVQSTIQEVPTRTSASSIPRSQQEETIAKAQIVFGSKLVGPQRRAQLDAQSKLVAGILVPPRPEEPDNCCMSGCVNCVWDMYRDEMEEWVAKSAEARTRIADLKAAASVQNKRDMNNTVAVSMDDDGGGSESNWNDEGPIIGDMFEGVPVGIRAFMETEKRLKKKHIPEDAAST